MGMFVCMFALVCVFHQLKSQDGIAARNVCHGAQTRPNVFMYLVN